MRALVVGLVVAIAGCEGSLAIHDPAPASADASADASLPCTPSGVSKGPWSLAVDGASAKIRWESCRAGGAPGVVVTPEAGGASTHVDASERATIVTDTYTAPLNPSITPDYAGTWYMHEASVTGLAPATCYRYALDADPATLAGRLCTARNPGDEVRFLAIGDTNPGLGDSTKNVLAHVLLANPDFTIHGGDIQYYDSYLETWTLWFDVMSPLLRSGAFFAAVGNHESEKPNELAQYDERFFAGAGFDGADDHYRFTSGGIWFFTLDTEQALEAGSDQATWLERELADAQSKPGFRFSVVWFHRPFVTCGDTGDDPAARALFEPMFLKYGVKLVIQAHMHGYERFEIGDLTYLTAAGGGASIGRVDANVSRPECSLRVASGPFFHGVVIDVTAGKLNGTVIDDKGTVRDSFEKVVP